MAETGEPLGKGLAGDPGTVGACGAVDMVPPLGCVELKMEGGAGQGTVTASQADRVGAGGKWIAADWDVEPDLAGYKTAPGPESCILVPGGRKIPPKKEKHMDSLILHNRTTQETILDTSHFLGVIHSQS